MITLCSRDSHLRTRVFQGLMTELTVEYRTHHFLAGLVLSELATVLETK